MNKFLAILLLLVACGSPESNHVSIDMRGNTVLIDGRSAVVEEIGSRIIRKIQGYDSLQKQSFYVELLVDEKTTTGIVVDVKEELRKLKIYKVVYITGPNSDNP